MLNWIIEITLLVGFGLFGMGVHHLGNVHVQLRWKHWCALLGAVGICWGIAYFFKHTRAMQITGSAVGVSIVGWAITEMRHIEGEFLKDMLQTLFGKRSQAEPFIAFGWLNAQQEKTSISFVALPTSLPVTFPSLKIGLPVEPRWFLQVSPGLRVTRICDRHAEHRDVLDTWEWSQAHQAYLSPVVGAEDSHDFTVNVAKTTPDVL